ncbi:MAG: ATP-dependent zinc metalloprotease FtsH [Oscillospiraceae bacterium]|nr:ATP-dependent zinc metalloprotease FtsH [Oscillospiraceae bacterium]
MNKRRGNLGVILLVLLVIVIIAIWMTPQGTVSTMSYSEMVSYFQNEQVTEFTLDLGSGEMLLQLKGQETPVEYKIGSMTLFMEDIHDYIQLYNEHHPDAPMVYDYLPAKETSLFVSMLPTLITLILMGALFIFMMRQTGGGDKFMGGMGKARVQDPNESGEKKTFADVAGADEEKAELQEIVEFLKDPSKYNRLGAKIPHGVLLQGPPGTGKTLLARACAGEANVPFYAISGSDFVQMFVGVGASRVRDLFEKAKKTAPSVVFIDEIDAVGRQRGAGLGGGNDEREQTLNQLLVEMDGFGANEGVIVIAATNRSDILDKALLRPGRFDRQIYVGTPDVLGREQILKVHTRNKPLAPDVDLAEVARSTTGFTGADLANLMNEAALLAVKRERKAITARDIQDSVTKVLIGVEKKSHRVTEKDKKLTAYHEAGHALITYFNDSQNPVHEVSIIPRGLGAGGYTMHLPGEDTSYMTKGQMETEIAVLLGGRVAEKLILEDISTGASSDLQRATDIARAMVTRYGFSDRLGLVVYNTDPGETFLGRDFTQGRGYSEEVASQIDSEIRDMLDSAFEKDRVCLLAHMEELHRLAAVLLEREKINGTEFVKVMKNEPLDPMPGKKPAAQQPAEESAEPVDMNEAKDAASEENDLTVSELEKMSDQIEDIVEEVEIRSDLENPE